MNQRIQELKTSWNHCKEVISSSSSPDLVIAFLEEFKVQFTKFYHITKSSFQKTYQQLSFSLIDKAYLFTSRKGELSGLISYIQHHWDAKQHIQRYVRFLDTIIIKIISLSSQNSSLA